ncbi:MAG: M20/M25/M40 family metallo-hydrolase [Chloroflexi bacterium]|nr:M20/M25/M40 family metallo-hydrolase [Chloroflexota bacterium]
MTNHTTYFDTFLQANLDKYIGETARLCAQPSVSAKNEGVRECAGLVAQTLESHGFRVQTCETAGQPVIVGHLDGESARTLMFYNHYDVQPPEPLELWTTPPFQPTIRDGALYARGAKDDKGEFVARLAAVDAIRAANSGKLPCGITFVLEGEEEIGSPHIAQFVREHTDLLKCHAAIWEEGGVNFEGHPGTALGRRGVLSVELAARTLNFDAHSGAASMLPNAAWRLVNALASLKDGDERMRIPGFYDHARPASPRDLELCDALPDRETWLRKNFGVKEFVGGRKNKALNRAVFQPTCNIAGITTGYQGKGMKTVTPAHASAKLDFRLVPDQDPDDIFKKLRAHLDAAGFADVTVTWLGAMSPYKASPGDPFIALTARTAEEVYQLPYEIEPIGGGSSPMYAFAAPLGNIPIVTAGVGYADNRTHSPNEHVRFGDFLNASRHIARIIDGFADL